MVFSESTNKTGSYELFQDLTETNTSSYTISKFTRDMNNAYAYFMLLAIRNAGLWQVDDTNQTDYPIITMNIVSGQQDYPFTVDGSSVPNQILDITRVECASDSAKSFWRVLDGYDQTDEDSALTQLATISGVPYRYDKLANGIWLDQKPNYSATAGLKVYFQRTPVYFLVSDTTKKAGIPDFFHEYLVYRCAYLYAVKNIPAIANNYFAVMQKMEKDIALYYSQRDRDEHRRITMQPVNFL